MKALVCIYSSPALDLSGWGNEIGSISIGKWADFVVLDGALNDPVGRELKQRQCGHNIFSWT